MKTCKLHLIIVSSEYMDTDSDEELRLRLSKIHVSEFSTVTTINVTRYSKDADTYIIALKADDLVDDIDHEVLINNIISLFATKMQECTVECSIGTSYTEYDTADDIDGMRAALELHNLLESNYKDITMNSTRFIYVMSDMIQSLYNNYTKSILNDIDSSDDEPDAAEYDVEEDNDISRDDFLRSYMNILDGYDDKGKKKKKKKKKQSLDYGTSKVIRSINNPKKAYRRHGVLVCSEKKAIDKDRRIIKEFLRDFIPGNASWKKKFRKDLLDRWIQVYVISKKRLKKLEKERDQQVNRANTSRNVQRTIEFTRKLFNVPVDQWNDPRR